MVRTLQLEAGDAMPMQSRLHSIGSARLIGPDYCEDRSIAAEPRFTYTGLALQFGEDRLCPRAAADMRRRLAHQGHAEEAHRGHGKE
jgi:hypothetical protein